MTILNKTNTATLQTALNEEVNFFVFLKNNTVIVSDAEYDILRQNFMEWKEAYEQEGLFGTTPEGNTFEFSGIDQFPIPPQR